MGWTVEGKGSVLGVMILSAFVSGCGDTDTADADAGWPKRVTLQAGFGQTSDAVRLADGAVTAEGGDVAFTFAVQLSLHDGGEALPVFCGQGTYGTLAEVPTDEQACTASGANRWEPRLFLGAGLIHDAEGAASIGLSALVRDAAGEATYRLRVLGDTVTADESGLEQASATFEYEPVP
jgi:hypothetical protein